MIPSPHPHIWAALWQAPGPPETGHTIRLSRLDGEERIAFARGRSRPARVLRPIYFVSINCKGRLWLASAPKRWKCAKSVELFDLNMLNTMHSVFSIAANTQ